MSTYYLTTHQWNEIKNRVPHANPVFYTDCGVPCVKVQIDDMAFSHFAHTHGWI